MKIRPIEDRDWDACWEIIQPVFAAGETYPYSGDIPPSEARHMWVVAPTATFVAENDDGDILGLYFIKPNQAGRGAHVCNCGYMVSPKARGQGVATVMCEHSQLEARRIGFTAMQFNFVVATNKTAVALWQRLGFEIIGTLPKVFDHAKLGKVDAHIMFKAFE